MGENLEEKVAELSVCCESCTNRLDKLEAQDDMTYPCPVCINAIGAPVNPAAYSKDAKGRCVECGGSGLDASDRCVECGGPKNAKGCCVECGLES